MNKPSIQNITLRHIVNLLILLAIVTVFMTGYHFHQLSQKALYNQALVHAEIVKAGLTAHMKAEVMPKRDYFLEEINQLENIRSLNIIRGPAVINQFGIGKHVVNTPNNENRSVFETSEALYIPNEFSITPSVRVIIPYIASSEGVLNCLICHQAEEGDVLGAIDLVLDISGYMRWSYLVFISILLISVCFLVLILFSASKSIKKNIQQPLENLIKAAREAYRHNQPLIIDDFKSSEFCEIAKEINQFNSSVLTQQHTLQEKSQQLIHLNEEIETTLRDSIFTMGEIVEKRSHEPYNHTRRISEYSRLLATLAGLTEQEVETVAAAAPLHDVGKIGIPDDIVLNPNTLDDKQQIIFEQHSLIGYAMLKHSKRGILQAAALVALQHHENWNGFGYPVGMLGERIHIYARIVRLADELDQLLASESGQPIRQISEVLPVILEQSGTVFDPHLAKLLIDNGGEFFTIYEQYPPTQH